MIVDFHTHIFPPEMIADRARFMAGEDWFTHLYGDPAARMAGAEELIEEMDRAGVDKAVALGFPFRSHDLCARSNSYLAKAARSWPGRIIGFANANPKAAGALAEIEHCLELGLKGIGELVPDSQGFDLADAGAIAPLADLAAENGLPMLIHLSEPVGHSYKGKSRTTPEKGYALARAFPALKLVFAHWGGGLPFYELMPEVRRDLAGACYDSAASPYLYDAKIFKVAVSLVGHKKILFGSDFPLLSPERCRREIEAAGLSPAEMKAILGGNAARLLEGDCGEPA